MAIVINGSGTVTGLSVGGLPDGSVDADTLASNAVTEAKIASNAVVTGKIADGTIANADINSSAAIAGSKISGSFGKVLQAVTDTDSSLQTFSSTSYGWVTNLEAAITPSSTSSKILVIASIPYTVHRVSGSRTDTFANLKLMRSIGAADTALQTTTPGISGIGNTVQVLQGLATFAFLDSPSTTSSTSYRVMARSRPDAAEINMKINYDYGDYTKGEPASITAIEIGA